jgi:NTE family protein
MPRDVGLALGGGGARGLAHIGVLGELERAGYRIAALAGTSIGGVIAAVYAAGLGTEEIAAWVQRAMQRGLFRFRPSAGALLGIDRIREVLDEALGDATFEQARCPVALTAVDLERGEEVVLNSGRLLDAVLATIALPGIFPPHFSGESRLVDGGVLDPVPVVPVRSLFRGPVVAVTLSARSGSPASPSGSPLSNLPGSRMLTRLRVGEALQVFSRSLEISSRLFADLRLQLDRPEVIIRPDVADIGILDTPDAAPLIEAGREAMSSGLPELEGWYGVRGALRRVAARSGGGPPSPVRGSDPAIAEGRSR